MSGSIPCKFCGHDKTRTIQSLPTGDYHGTPRVYRRRECESCKQRFTTYEDYAEEKAARVPYSPERGYINV